MHLRPDRITTLSPEQRELLRKMLSQGDVDPTKLPVPPRTEPDDPLTRAQEAMWFLCHMAPDSAVYNLASGVRLRGALVVDALARALVEVAQRHAVLRTVFPEVGARPRQRVLADALPELEHVDVAPLVRGDELPLVAVSRDISARSAEPFDFAQRPPWRAMLYRIDEREHVLAFVHHHLVWDGWSIGVMIRELEACYAAALSGTMAQLRPLGLSYGDFARWERAWVGPELLERRAQWWRTRLRGFSELQLPLDRPRPPRPDFRGAASLIHFVEPPGFAALLERTGATPYMVLLSAFAVVLMRWSGQARFMLGTPYASRGRPEFDALIGHFANLLVLPLDSEGDPSFAELVARTRGMAAEVFDHADLPFDALVEQLGVEREAARNPVFQVLFGLHSEALEQLRLNEVEVEPMHVGSEVTHFDLSLHLWRREGSIGGFFSYARELFDAETIARLGAQLDALLQVALAQPDRPLSQLDALPPVERAWLTGQAGGPARALAEPDPVHAEPSPVHAESLAVALSRSLEQEPDALALCWGEQALTRGELDSAATALGEALAGETIVASLLEPSPALALAGVACARAGISLLVLDPELDARRLPAGSKVRVLTASEDPRAPQATRVDAFWGRAPEPEQAAQAVEIAGEGTALMSIAGGQLVRASHADLAQRVMRLEHWLGLGAAGAVELGVGAGPRWLALALWALQRGTLVRSFDPKAARRGGEGVVILDADRLAELRGRPQQVIAYGPLGAAEASACAARLGCPLRRLYAPPEVERELGLASLASERYLAQVERAQVSLRDEGGSLLPTGAIGRVVVDGVTTRERGRWHREGGLELLALEPGWALHRGARVDLGASAARIAASSSAIADALVQVLPAQGETPPRWLVSLVTIPEHVDIELLDKACRAALPTGVELGLSRASHIPLDAQGQPDRAQLRALPVVDAQLCARWLAHAESLPGVEASAAAIVPDRVVVPLRHLNELLPGLGPVAADEHHSTIDSALESERGAADSHAERPLAEADGGPLPAWDQQPPPASLVEAMLRAAEASVSNGRGLTFVEVDGERQTLRYDVFVEEARRMLAWLRAQGLRPGDRVVLHQPRLVDHFRVMWACFLGGITPVTVARPPTYDEPNALLSKLRNAWRLLGQPPILASEALGELLLGAGELFRADEGEAWQPFAVLATDTVALEQLEPAPVHMPAHDDVVFLQLTSGSTGVPKCIPETNRAVLAHAFGATALNGYRRDDVVLNWLPTDHVAPILMSHGRAVVLGAEQIHAATTYILGDPLRWLELMHEHRVSLTWSPNFGFRQVADAVARNPERSWDLSCVRMMMNAGEQVTLPVVRDFLERLAPFGIVEGAMQPAYGMAETSTAMTYANDFRLAQPAVRVRKASLGGQLEQLDAEEGQSEQAAAEVIDFIDLGPPIPGVRVRIAGPDQRTLPEMMIGMVQVRGDVILPGYLDNPAANAAAFPGNGWFDSGDLGFLRNGRLFITGRRKETIIIRGANFYCYEIEDQIEAVEGVEATFSAAVAVDEAGAGTEGLALFFVPEREELLTAPGQLVELVERITERVTREFGVRPRHVLPLARETFPKTTSGKIQRGQLKRRLMRGEYDELIAGLELAAESPATTIPQWFMRWAWRPRPLAGALGATGRGGSTHRGALIIADLLADELRARLPMSVLVTPGVGFERVGNLHFQMAVNDPECWAQLLDQIPPPTLVIHALGLEAGAAEEGLDRAHAVLTALQALGGRTAGAGRTAGSGRPTPVLVACAQAVSVNEHELPHPARAALRGLVTTAAREWPMLALRLVDLEPEPDPEPDPDAQSGAGVASKLRAQCLVAELDGDAEPEVAWRGAQRLVPRLRHLELGKRELPPTPPLREGEVVLVTGGLGGVGLRLIKLLLGHFHARVVVTGRSELTGAGSGSSDSQEPSAADEAGLVQVDLEQRLAALRELQSMPGELVYERADVCDAEAMARVLAAAEQRWGEPVAGAFHLAGHSPIRMLAEETRESLASTCGPKLRGAEVLLDALAPEAFFVAASSVYACFGATASGAYAAANSALEALAARARREGRARCYAYTFSYWEGVGMSRGYAFREQARELGYFSMDARQALHSLLVLLSREVPDALVGVDRFRPNIARFGEGPARAPATVLVALRGLDAAVERLRAHSIEDRFGRATTCRATRVEQLPTTATGGLDWRALGSGRRSALVCGVGGALGQVVRPRTSLERVIAAAWSEALGLEDIDIDQTFFALGGQSLQLVAVLSRLEGGLNRKLSIVEFFRYPTIRSLAAYLEQGQEAQAPALDAAVSRGQRQRQRKRRDPRRSSR